jgi:hypothetical protein
MDADLDLPPFNEQDFERALAWLLRALYLSILDGLTVEALRLLRTQCAAQRTLSAAEREMLRLIDARLARTQGQCSSAPRK